MEGIIYRQGYDWDTEIYKELLEAMIFHKVEENFLAIDATVLRKIVSHVYPNECQSHQPKYRNSLANFLAKYEIDIKADLNGKTF